MTVQQTTTSVQRLRRNRRTTTSMILFFLAIDWPNFRYRPGLCTAYAALLFFYFYDIYRG